jgi:5'-3' exonuclease
MGTVNMLQKVVNDRKPALFAVAMDSRTPSFRKSLDPRYKATRPPPPPDLVSQMVRCREVVDAYAIPVFQEDGLEADDLIAAVTSRALEDGLVVVVVSADKDLMQLVRDHDSRVVLWDSMRDRVYGPAEVAQKFGVPPSKLRDLLALTGDSSDNVPGVPSVGPKTAADLLNQFGTLDAIYTHLADVKRPKLREALAANEADARLSRTLVTLKADAEISWDPQALAYGGADVPRLRALFAELEFTRLRDMLDQANGERPAPSPARQGRDGEPNVAAPKAPPRPAPSALVRTQATLLEARALSALVDRARAKGRLGVAVLTAGSDDPDARVARRRLARRRRGRGALPAARAPNPGRPRANRARGRREDPRPRALRPERRQGRGERSVRGARARASRHAARRSGVRPAARELRARSREPAARDRALRRARSCPS